jgi:ferredoxin
MTDKEPKQLSRREFATGVGSAGIGAVLGGLFLKGFLLPDQVFAIPASKGYLLVDTKKCGGCESCMLACSLVHEGKENISMSRIQITQNPFGKFPDDMSQTQCERQRPHRRPRQVHRLRALHRGVPVHPVARFMELPGRPCAEVRPVREDAVHDREGRPRRAAGMRRDLPHESDQVHLRDSRAEGLRIRREPAELALGPSRLPDRLVDDTDSI